MRQKNGGKKMFNPRKSRDDEGRSLTVAALLTATSFFCHKEQDFFNIR
jgi:hypothetical protein